MPPSDPLLVRRKSFPLLPPSRHVIIRLVRALIPPSPLSVAQLLEQRRGCLEVKGGEGAARMHRLCLFPRDGSYLSSVAVGFSPGGGGFLRFTAAGFNFREGEISSAPPSSALVPESGGSQSSNLPVLNSGYFWVFFLVRDV